MSQDLGDDRVTDMHGLSHGKEQEIKHEHTAAKLGPQVWKPKACGCVFQTETS